MAKKENLLFLLGSNESAVRRLVDDVTDEESLVRGKDNLQHIRWQTGHLVYNAYLILRSLGEPGSLPDNWDTLFRRGCGFSDDANMYPSMAELRDKLYWFYDQIKARASKMSDDELDQVLDPEPVFDTGAMNAALFFCTHEFYHAGQIVIIRRILGRERPFG